MPPPIAVIQAKKRKVLQVATQMFLELGYDKTTIDALTEKVGGSKVYIFKTFGGKDKLFEAIVIAACEEILRPLSRTRVETKDLKEGLTQLGERFLKLSLSPKSIALHRLIIGERLRFPHLGELFLESGPEKSYKVVSDYLAMQQANGVIKQGDTYEMAIQFLGMLNAGFVQRMLVAGRPAPGKKIQQNRLETAADTFIRGITPSKK